MLKLVFNFLFCFCLFHLPALTPIQSGAKLGFNLSQHYGTKGDDQDFEVKTGMRVGLIAGAYLDLQLLPNFTLGYELLYSMKGSCETITIKRVELDGEMQDLPNPATMKVSYFLDYLEIPILLKVKVLDTKHFSSEAITGTAMAIKVKGQHRLSGEVYLPEGDDFSTIAINESSKLDNVNLFDYSFVYGGNLSLKTKLPLHLEYRFTLGWDYLSLPTYQLFEPVSLRNQTYSLILVANF